VPDRSVFHHTVCTHEIDSLSRVPLHVFVQWFQDAAIKASNEHGFNPTRYRELNSSWYVREITIELLSELRMHDEISTWTWAADFERIVGPRQYRIVRPDETVVANAEAMWVYVRRDTGRPTRLDVAVIEGFPTVSDWVLSDRQWGTDILDSNEQPASVLERPHSVLWSEIDGARHVNNTVYAQWLTDQLANASPGRGPGTVRRVRIRYENAIPEGSEIVWSTGYLRDDLWYHQITLADEGTVMTRAVIQVEPPPQG
jgi:acyl-CoA thioesterase FadM